MVIAVVFAIPLGYLAAKRTGTTFDNGTVVLSLIGVAVPVFFLAFLLKYWFAIETPVFPVSGRQDSGSAAPRHRLLRPRRAASPARSTARPTRCATSCCPRSPSRRSPSP